LNKIKRYLDFKPSLIDESLGAENGKDEWGYYSMVQCPDVWSIKSVFNMSKESTGYPTQKPLALMERIIKASSKKDDIILDPFCGCATTCVAAEYLGRKWIGIDIAAQSVDLVMERLKNAEGHLFSKFINLTQPPQRTDVEILEIKAETKKLIKEKLFNQQNCHCNGCQKEFEIIHLEIDHVVPKAKGGGDYMENYQLLCSNCNRMKGDRPMDYLRMKIEERRKLLKNKIRFGE
jgi:site-specific DNA-methyltransferase (adenine-specific)